MATEAKHSPSSCGSRHSPSMSLHPHKVARPNSVPGFSGPVSVLADTVHSLATRFHLIPASGNDLEAGYTQLPGGARAEAERRR